MDNAAVAAVFLEMGDLLLIQGGDPYRARAFKRTAQILEGIREPVAELMKMNRLIALPGIGPGSVERIKQILQTGTCFDHQRLLRRLPQGLRDLLKVRGMGPRNVRLVYESLGVRNVTDLERAAKAGLLAKVPGIGDKTVQRVLNHLEDMKKAPVPRMLLSDALRTGEELVGFMRDESACLELMQTGSARRRKETVGDLDILVATHRPKACVARFVQFPSTREVLLAGESRASVIVEGGMQADLRVVTPETFGAGLHYFTGSKQHNIQVRMRANQMKLHFSEHGVWERKLFGRGHGEENRKIARRVVAGRTEEELFAAVRLPFIVPEIREGDGEVEAAAEGRLPSLVALADLRGDLCCVPADAREASAMLHRARSAGLSWIVVAQPFTTVDEVVLWRTRLERTAPAVGVDFLLGCLATIGRDGELLVDPDVARAADLVIGEPRFARDEDGLIDGDAATAQLVAALDAGRIDVLRHPTERRLLEDKGAPIDVWRVLKAAARARVIVDVSGDPHRLELEARALRTNREIGASIALSSSATRADELSQLALSLSQARRGWTAPELVVNTFPLAAVVERLRERQQGAPAPGAVPPKLSTWVAPVVDPEVEALKAALDAPLDAALLERLQAFLVGTEDVPLERALTDLSGNALQRAFELVAASRGEDASPASHQKTDDDPSGES